MKRRFVTVDVFTDRPLGGNPLAVVLDAEGLSADDMQAIAREFNLSETTFVLPPDDPAHTARVRIFTPGREVPFAGHPNVGTAFVLASEGEIFGRPCTGRLTFEESAGLVPVDILLDATERPAGACLTAPRTFETTEEMAPGVLAVCVGLDTVDIDTQVHTPVVASAGLPFPVARLASPDALARARPDVAAIARVPAAIGHLFVYVPDPAAPDTFRARMFAPGLGVTEDPATGSAAAALAGLLASLEDRDGRFAYTIVQGVEMGRPSRIETEADVTEGKIAAVRVGGACVPVMRGEIEI